MGVYKYDATNDVLVPIAGTSAQGIEDKVSTYTADSSYWDTSPTSASTKPVTSGGVYTALADKADASDLTTKVSTYATDSSQWDTSPTGSSTKPVTSGGIKTELDKKLPTYSSDSSSWDTTPTASSTNPVTSGGVYTALRQMSYVGMIIHSTTFNTEAKVKAFYGGTKWIQHSGYVLRGATSGVTSNSATKTGGSDDAIVVKHNHTQNAHSHAPGSGSNFAVYGTSTSQIMYQGSTTQGGNFASRTGNTTATNNETGEDGTNKNLPNYKSVYIWERTQ